MKKERLNGLIRYWTKLKMEVHWSSNSQKGIMNKIAFQWDAYRPLVDRIPACTVQRGCTWLWGVYLPGRGLYLPRGTCQGVYLPGWGVYLLGGCTCWGCTCPGGCTCPEGYLLGGGCTCWGCTCWGVYLLGGVPARGCIPACNGTGTPHPPMNRMTDRQV